MNLIISIPTQADFVIHEVNGLYSLNDLHKASGGNPKHQPSNFLRNQETQALITAIEQDGSIAYHAIQGGKVQGTYVCRELVYRYGMWISAKFSLMVIRAFDRMTKGETIPCLAPTQADTLTDKDWSNLKRLVWLCENNFRMQRSAGNAIWARLRTVTGVKSPDKFSPCHLPLLAAELERIFKMSELYNRATQAIEAHVIRNVLKYADDEVLPFFLEEMHQKALDYQSIKDERLPAFFKQDYRNLIERI